MVARYSDGRIVWTLIEFGDRGSEPTKADLDFLFRQSHPSTSAVVIPVSIA